MVTWPDGFPLVAVTGSVRLGDEGARPHTYGVTLTASMPALTWDGETFARRKIILLSEHDVGDISGSVPLLNAPGLSPAGGYYTVREFVDGRPLRPPWDWAPNGDETVVDLDDLAPIVGGGSGTPVAVGPPGPTVVSSDAGNIATLGSDDFLYVPGPPVTSVNGETGAVSLSAADVGADVAGAAASAVSAHASGAGAHSIAGVSGLQSALDGKAAALGPDENYVSDAEKAALHGHSNKAALDAVSGVNTGDQALPTWSTIGGKPAVVAAGATQADARSAIGAGTSSFSGVYSDLAEKPVLGLPVYVQQAQPTGPAVWFVTNALGQVVDIWTVDA